MFTAQGPRNTIPLSYTTNFSTIENPLSENGKWTHLSSPWAKLKTVSGPNRVIGTQVGGQGFNDSYGLLSGFRANVTAQGTVYKDPSINGDTTGNHEVELLVRMLDTATTIRGYECNLSFDGLYSQIVRWNGALGDFTVLSNSGGNAVPVTGDIFKVVVTGNSISSFLNGTLLTSFSDSTYTDGNPGIGMWLQDAAFFSNQSLFGFTNYSVVEN